MKLEPDVERLLSQRYYLPGEDWAQLTERVIEYVCEDESEEFRESAIAQMTNRIWLPNSPCMVNSGQKNGGLMACFVVGPEEDTLEEHGYALVDIATVGKRGGGCGFTGTFIRPEGSRVHGSAHDRGAGVAYGPNNWAVRVSEYLHMITQGGYRSMALMYTLDAEHEDIHKFIDLKQNGNEQFCYNFNQSVMASDAWMVKATNGDKARSDTLWKIAENAWANGEPGILFKSQINNNTPYITCGCRIHTTNPCGEQPLPSYGSCNLGSINIAHDSFINDGHYDYVELEKAVRTITRFLDNVGSRNIFPNNRFRRWYEDHRPIGIGIMGLADLFLKFGIKYGSRASTEFLRSIMGFIQTMSWDESRKLGYERGVPSHCDGVDRRNITTVSIAPTGSIAFIARCSHGIEPIFAPKYTRTDERGEEYVFEHPQANEPFFASSINDDHSKMPTWKEHIKIQAAAQSRCDSGVSKTINFPNGATIEDVYNAIVEAWVYGCKGVTAYRDGSRLKQVLEVAKEEDSTLIDCPTGVCTI